MTLYDDTTLHEYMIWLLVLTLVLFLCFWAVYFIIPWVFGQGFPALVGFCVCRTKLPA